MRRILIVSLLIAGCQVGGLKGQCADNSECPAPSICDTAQHVCTAPPGQCFPACPSGQQCVQGANGPECKTVSSTGCDPACSPTQTCVGNTCVNVTQPT